MKNYLLLLILLLSVYGYGQGNKKLLFDSNKYYLYNAVTGSATVSDDMAILTNSYTRTKSNDICDKTKYKPTFYTVYYYLGDTPDSVQSLTKVLNDIPEDTLLYWYGSLVWNADFQDSLTCPRATIAPNGGGVGTTDWVDTDGIAYGDDWSGASTSTKSVKTGEGFNGRSQYYKYTSGVGGRLNTIPFIFAGGTTYVVGVRYKTDATNVRITTENFDVSFPNTPLPTASTPTWAWRTITPVSNRPLWFYQIGVGKYLQIDEVTVYEMPTTPYSNLHYSKGTEESIRSILYPPTYAIASGDTSKVTLTWVDNSSKEWVYYIERKDITDNGEYAFLDSVGANVTTYVDTPLTSEHQYQYRIYAKSFYSTSTSTESNLGSPTIPAGEIPLLSFTSDWDYGIQDSTTSLVPATYTEVWTGDTLTTSSNLGGYNMRMNLDDITAGGDTFAIVAQGGQTGNTSTSYWSIGKKGVGSSYLTTPTAIYWSGSRSKTLNQGTMNQSDDFYLSLSAGDDLWAHMVMTSGNVSDLVGASSNYLLSGLTNFADQQIFTGASSWSKKYAIRKLLKKNSGSGGDADTIKTFYIVNDNASDIIIDSYSLDGIGYSFTDTSPDTVSANDSLGIVVSFNRYQNPGVYNGTFTITYDTYQLQIPLSAVIVGNPPIAPSNLQATGNIYAVALTWSDNSSDENKFYIERKHTDSTWAVLDSVNASVVVYNDTANGLVTGGTYDYRIRALKYSAGFSAYSNTAGATVQAPVYTLSANHQFIEADSTEGSSGSTGSWQSIWTALAQVGSGSWLSDGGTETDNYRTIIKSANILRNASAIKVVWGGNSGTAFAVSGAAFGEKKASSDAFDFVSAPTRILFSGSNASSTFTGEKTSDSLAVTIDSTKTYLISSWGNGGAYLGYTSAASGTQSYTKTVGSDQSQTTDVATYSTDGSISWTKQILGYVGTTSEPVPAYDTTYFYIYNDNPIPLTISSFSGLVAPFSQFSVDGLTISAGDSAQQGLVFYLDTLGGVYNDTLVVNYTGGYVLNIPVTLTLNSATVTVNSPSAMTATGDTLAAHLTWTDNSTNEDSFQVYRNNSFLKNLTAGTTSYTDTASGLVAEQTYSYKVRAVLDSPPTYSAFSNSSDATVIDTAGTPEEPPTTTAVDSLYTFDIDYYVDAINGSDANNGRTPATAWKTITKVNNSASLFNTELAGDTCVIAFNQNATWRVSVTGGDPALSINAGASDTRRMVYVGSWDNGRDGKKAKFLMSTDAKGTTGSWTDMGSNIWQRSFTATVNTLESYNGVQISFVKDGVAWFGDDIDNSAGASAYTITYTNNSSSLDQIYKYDWDSNVLRVYCTSNPATYFDAIECHQSTSNGAMMLSNDDYVWIDNFEIAYANTPNSMISGDTDNDWLRITRCNLHHAGVLGTFNTDTGRNHYVYLNGDYIYMAYNCAWESIEHGYVIYAYGSSRESGGTDHVVFEHNFVGSSHYTGTDFATTFAHQGISVNIRDWDIRYNVYSDSGSQFNASATAAGIQVLGTYGGSYPSGALSYFRNVRIYGNIFNGFNWTINGFRMADSIYFVNNTLVNGGTTNFQSEGTNTGAYLRVYNNILGHWGGVAINNNYSTNIIYDNNILWNFNGTTSPNISTWNANSYVIDDYSANPNFISFTTHETYNNFRLGVSSYAKDKGLTLSDAFYTKAFNDAQTNNTVHHTWGNINIDPDGNTRGTDGTWDIGAYEYVP